MIKTVQVTKLNNQKNITANRHWIRLTDLQKIKNIELSILDYIVDLCDKNNLTYYLAYGTLIGAVRHHGFIPWDDDIDIWMPRRDYEKLCNLWPKDGHYRLGECERDADYIYPFAKVWDERTRIKERNTLSSYQFGIFIDIFPLDDLPDDPQRMRKYLKKNEFLEKCRVRSMFSRKSSGHKNPLITLCRYLFWYLLRMIGTSRLARILNRRAQKHNGKKAVWMGSLVNQDLDNECCPASWFGEGAWVTFEGRTYRAPAQYDKVLTNAYGDYMQLPPKEQQVLKHGFAAWELSEGK